MVATGSNFFCDRLISLAERHGSPALVRVQISFLLQVAHPLFSMVACFLAHKGVSYPFFFSPSFSPHGIWGAVIMLTFQLKKRAPPSRPRSTRKCRLGARTEPVLCGILLDLPGSTAVCAGPQHRHGCTLQSRSRSGQGGTPEREKTGPVTRESVGKAKSSRGPSNKPTLAWASGLLFTLGVTHFPSRTQERGCHQASPRSWVTAERWGPASPNKVNLQSSLSVIGAARWESQVMK